MNNVNTCRGSVMLMIQFSHTLLMCPVALLVLLLCAQPALAQGSGLNSTEGLSIAACDGSSGCGSIHSDTLWADSTIHRWKMMNDTNNSSPLVVGQWACTTPGCLLYSASSLSSGIYPETELTIGSQGSFLQVNSSLLPNWSTSPTLGKNGTGGTTGQLNLANGNSSGASIGLENTSATAAYNFIFPASAGTAGDIFLSGGGSSANTWTGYTIPTGTATSGGLLYATSTSATAFSGALTQYGVLYGGGAGASPIALTPLTADQFLQGTSTSPHAGSLPSCSTGGDFLQYTQGSTHALSCNALLGGITGSLTGTEVNVASSAGTYTTNDLVCGSSNGGIHDCTSALTVASTANQDYLILPYISFPSSNPPSTVLETTANTVVFIEFVLPFKTVANHATVNVTVASTSTNTCNTSISGCVLAGIYSFDGTNWNLVSGSGVLFSCASTGNITAATGSTITLQPGHYMYAYGATDNTCKVSAQAAAGWMGILNQNSSKRVGTAGNAIQNPTTSAAMPSTLGTLTSQNGGENVLLSAWEP